MKSQIRFSLFLLGGTCALLAHPVSASAQCIAADAIMDAARSNRVLVAECSFYEGDYAPGKVPLEVKSVYYDGQLPSAPVEFKRSNRSYFAQVQFERVVHSHGVHDAAELVIGIDGHAQFGADVTGGSPLLATWYWLVPGDPEDAVANSMRCFNPSAPHIPI